MLKTEWGRSECENQKKKKNPTTPPPPLYLWPLILCRPQWTRWESCQAALQTRLRCFTSTTAETWSPGTPSPPAGPPGSSRPSTARRRTTRWSSFLATSSLPARVGPAYDVTSFWLSVSQWAPSPRASRWCPCWACWAPRPPSRATRTSVSRRLTQSWTIIMLILRLRAGRSVWEEGEDQVPLAPLQRHRHGERPATGGDQGQPRHRLGGKEDRLGGAGGERVAGHCLHPGQRQHRLHWLRGCGCHAGWGTEA